MGSRITYLTVRIMKHIKGKAMMVPTFRALHHVSHQEAIGILDPFQRWSSEAAQCVICGQPNSATFYRNQETCNSTECTLDYHLYGTEGEV